MDYPGKVITKTQVTPTQTSASGNWTLDDQAAAIKNNNWPVALVPNPISKSLRFNSADTAYLNRTFSTPTSQNIWSFSCWLKRSSLADLQFIFWAGTSATNDCALYFTSSDQIGWFTNNGVSVNSTSTAVFRDPSAWYHVVAIANSTTMNVYVNNQQVITNAGMTNNTINSAIAHCIGQDLQTSGNEFSGYLTEINFIDGQALTPSSFGMTNPQTGQWIPLKYSGTYGTNGFYLNFKDATSTTTLGYDYSGNANNWTTNNFSVTAGAGNDSLTDVPTPWFAYNTTGDVGGVIRGNYCTWNPLYGSTPTLTNGNLDATTNNTTAYGTVSVTSGKWYWEILVGNASYIGVMDSTYIKPDGSWSSQAIAYVSNGNKYNGTGSAYGASYTTNDIIGVALDMDAGTIVFYKNGSSQGTAFSSGIAGKEFRPFVYSSTSGTQTANFGQRPFAYTPPTGFLSLCTTNLPATAIGFGLTNQGDDYMNVVLYTGDGIANRSVTGVGFQPDLVWIKSRSNVTNHKLLDSVRGAGLALSSDLTNADIATSNFSFLSDGFSVPAGTNFNSSGYTYVGWNWKASGSTVSNTAGTITSTVSANTTAGFSVVTWTGNGGSSENVGTGLSTTSPLAMAIVKRRSGTSDWWVGHQGIQGRNFAYRVLLNSTAASSGSGPYVLGSQSSTNGDRLYLSTEGAASAVTYVAYCFQQVPGYSAFGSYTGNASTDGPFIYTGFRPKFILVKQTNTTRDWKIYDSARNTYNITDLLLTPNLSDAEQTGTNNFFDFLSNGFKIRSSGATINDSGGTYIYMAFAESPFQFANAR